MDLEFVKLTNNISSSENVPDNMINCLASLGSEWKKNHINKMFNYLERYIIGKERW